ncbi:uncharacterized protein LOC128859082 [Anastrepha ludens]|uniref:uncharacterized protein LOC128859082 n=1 Tax=Anastrepha ludens TaxID=28586 RepID=UPI0023B101D6|nr:uncharacterized protein LOC128859082 [Anastrepha ludens]
MHSQWRCHWRAFIMALRHIKMHNGITVCPTACLQHHSTFTFRINYATFNNSFVRSNDFEIGTPQATNKSTDRQTVTLPTALQLSQVFSLTGPLIYALLITSFIVFLGPFGIRGCCSSVLIRHAVATSALTLVIELTSTCQTDLCEHAWLWSTGLL